MVFRVVLNDRLSKPLLECVICYIYNWQGSDILFLFIPTHSIPHSVFKAFNYSGSINSYQVLKITLCSNNLWLITPSRDFCQCISTGRSQCPWRVRSLRCTLKIANTLIQLVLPPTTLHSSWEMTTASVYIWTTCILQVRPTHCVHNKNSLSRLEFVKSDSTDVDVVHKLSANDQASFNLLEKLKSLTCIRWVSVIGKC